MNEVEKLQRSPQLAKRLYVAWHCAHGIRGWDEAWEELGEWGQGYWVSVAQWVYDHFDERAS